jgi:hypothetical protein
LAGAAAVTAAVFAFFVLLDDLVAAKAGPAANATTNAILSDLICMSRNSQN